MSSKNNANITLIKTENNQKGASDLRIIPVKINSAIKKFEQKRLAEIENPDYYEVFLELSDLTGLAESTLRAYCNRFTPKYPTMDKLISLCKILNDRSPIEAFYSLSKALIEDGE